MRSTREPVRIAFAGLLLVAACGVSSRNGGTRHDGGSNLGDGGNWNGSDGNFVDPGNGDMAGASGCTDQAKLVYVVDENNTLSSFDPMALKFHDLGTLSCPTSLDPSATPFSMSVDRNAVAWVLYSDGELFSVDTTKTPLHCNATTFQPNQQSELVFGMGFVADAPMSDKETLYIAGGQDVQGSSELAKIDMMSLTVSTIAGVNGNPELTGNGNAELWGFFPDQTSPRVSKIDKASGAFSHNYPLSQLAGQPLAWAFATWGGDFFIFLKRTQDSSTIVWQLHSSTGQVTAAIPDSGRTIVGAGVSTCAPVTIQ